LQYLGNIEWLTRVPLTVKAAQKLVREMAQDADTLISSQQVGYSYAEVKQKYGGIEQRWLVVESQKRRESDLKSLEKKIKKELGAIENKLKDLSYQNFACKSDAIKAANQLLKKSKYHKLASINTQVVFIKDEKAG